VATSVSKEHTAQIFRVDVPSAILVSRSVVKCGNCEVLFCGQKNSEILVVITVIINNSTYQNMSLYKNN
jgi:hypothetical protein